MRVALVDSYYEIHERSYECSLLSLLTNSFIDPLQIQWTLFHRTTPTTTVTIIARCVRRRPLSMDDDRNEDVKPTAMAKSTWSET